MVRPSRFLRALAAGIGSTALLVAAAPAPAVSGAPASPPRSVTATPAASELPSATGAHSARDRTRAAVRDTSPLRVRIDSLAPSYLPAQGQIEVHGTVTNRSRETWTAVRLYTFMGDDLEPMTNAGDLAAAMEEPLDAYAGDRVVDQGLSGSVDALEPGETAAYVVRVPVTAFEVSGGGVYWFGVHALGESLSTPRDEVADGRARTFLPYVPRRIGTPLPTALALPLIRAVPHSADGSLAAEDRWARSLSPEGRLRDLLSFAQTAGDIPLTWVVDPALLDAVDRLATGNPPRSLQPTGPDGEPTATEGPTEGESDGGSGGADGASDTQGDQESPPATTTPAGRAASAWLDVLPDAFAGNEVLTVPYGNLDVQAALRLAPGLYEVALAQRSEVLERLEVETSPVLATPGGYVNAQTVAAAGPDATVLASDRIFPDQAPSVAQVDGHDVVVTSSGATEGTPGPGGSVEAVGLRQRILAEAAVRALKKDPQPLTVMLPTDWDLTGAAEFFGGLQVDWLDLDTVSGARSAATPVPVAGADLDYPDGQERRELDASTFAVVDGLLDTGGTLEDVLVDDTRISGAITEEALTGLGYSTRNSQVAARASIAASRDWLLARLAKVHITASPGVTLASASGTFVVTLSNDLDQAVTVSIRANEYPDLSIVDPEPVELAPGARTNVQLEARTSSNKVHNVTLMVTDADGRPLGASDQLPIRSAQVSDVIWVIMGTGVGLLFLAILVRLVRRVRAARRGEPASAS